MIEILTTIYRTTQYFLHQKVPFQIGNNSSTVAQRGLDEIAQLENHLQPSDIGIAYLLKSIFHAQLNQLKQAEQIISDNDDILRDNENTYLYPAAQLELGNLYRLVGKLVLFAAKRL